MDLQVLVKYAQGAVLFNSYFDYLKFLKPPERKIYLAQIVELIGHFQYDDSMAQVVIEKSGLMNDCPACLILQEGINRKQLLKILKLPKSELESSFKLLLTLFSIGYQHGYRKNKNASDKFWYWDYSKYENTVKYIQLNYLEKVRLDDILRP